MSSEVNDGCDQDLIDDIDSEVRLCVDLYSSTLGACCLNFAEKKLYLIEDTSINGDLSPIIGTIINQFQAKSLIVSSRIPSEIVQELTSLSEQYSFRISISAASEFTCSNLESLIKELKSEELMCTETGSIHYYMLQNLVTRSSDMAITIGTLNALWTSVKSSNLSDGSIKYFNTIEIVGIQDKMFIDVDSLHALQIMPSFGNRPQFNQKSQKMSLYELLDGTETSAGSKLLRDWIIRPLCDIPTIIDRQNAVELLTLPQNAELLQSLKSNLKKIGNITPVIEKIGTGQRKWSQWKLILQFLEYSVRICDLVLTLSVEGFAHELPSCFANSATLSQNDTFRALLEFMEDFIDFETSFEIGTVSIKPGRDSILDELRSKYNELEVLLQSTVKETSISIGSVDLDNINAVYIPQIGFLISLSCGFEQGVGLGSEIQDWKETFRTSTHIYFKTRTTEQLDSDYGDIYELICDREIEIIQELKQFILKEANTMLEFHGVLIELDCLCAMATVANSYKLCKPAITDNFELDIKDGRNLLVESYVDSFVPNNFSFTNYEDIESKVVVITGPNMSGKSVLLLQVAMIVVLAQIGSFVPASAATIGMVDKLLSTVQTRESLDKRQSTFALDINQISKCICLPTERSLIIIDEFGKGSDAIDGQALFGSVINHLASKPNCPRTLATTHFHELFRNDQNIIREEWAAKIKYFQMDILLSTNGEEITFLYRLKDGISYRSFGNYCAKVCGISEVIVSRAQELMQKLEAGKNLVQEFTQMSADDHSDFEKAKAIAHKFLSLQLNEADTSTENVELILSQFHNLFR
ncbi:muts domain V-domain-containing protein [Scheffersomyces coipomensis]|uniref:muts domain V-domain-containing protein n=1 Tax=Scheffersomyces coipomensis TaxID=1788519 RepID=UPI00315D1F9C